MSVRAPFPWFGGKSRAAHLVWEALGDVANYVEPFAGSAAVLLARPHAPRCETINDRDGMVANFWRAVRAAPAEVAHHADWPVNEADLHARHRWLIGQRESLTERLIADPEWYDARIAGWWCWGACAWIGDGWCVAEVRKLPHLGDAPAVPDPCARAPAPPPRDTRVVPLRVGDEALREALALADEPSVPRVQVGLVHGPVRVMRDLSGCGPHRAPEVRDHPVAVVDRLAARRVRTRKEHRRGARERLDVVGDVPQRLPHEMRRAALAAEPREGGANAHRTPGSDAAASSSGGSGRRRTRYAAATRSRRAEASLSRKVCTPRQRATAWTTAPVARWRPRDTVSA